VLVLTRDNAIMSFMLVIATLITLTCGVKVDKLFNTATFKSGMTACVCVLGVAWLGDTFVVNHTDAIKNFAGDFYKGLVDKIELPEELKEGIVLHRIIDRITDRNENFLNERC